MLGKTRASEQLPLNFPQTFPPERRLLSHLLSYAATNSGGRKEEISEATGIPTGDSSGKVEPMIHYARGMGLVRAEKTQEVWKLGLTPLGNIVLNEDPYLSETITLWVMHLMLCRPCELSDSPKGISDTWFALFSDGAIRLGEKFTQAAYLDSLKERLGTKGYLKNLSGLVLRTYLEDNYLGLTGALAVDKTVDGTFYQRGSAPRTSEYYPAYAAYLFLLWDELCPTQLQIPLDELLSQSRMLSLMNWDSKMASPWLDWMADHGMLQLDRQTGGTLALRLLDTPKVVSDIYSELI